MKSDAQLQRDVHDLLEVLRCQRGVQAQIGVAVKDGVVTLTGYVSTYAQKFAAEQAAGKIVGVKAVSDHLRVKLPRDHERTDTDLLRAVSHALKWHSDVPDRVKARVDDGLVILDGTVDRWYQKAAAELAVRYLTGIKDVMNLIALKPQASTYEVSQKIKDSLRRTADRAAQGITIDVQDGKVTLRGSVRSRAEREDVKRAAWAAPGVTFVEDNIMIGV